MCFDNCKDLLCNCSPRQDLEHLHLTRKCPFAPFQSALPLLQTQTTQCRFIIRGFCCCSRTFYKQNPTVGASFLRHAVLHVHPLCCMSQLFTPLCSCTSLFIHPPVDWHFGRFQFRAIMSKASMNILIQTLHYRTRFLSFLTCVALRGGIYQCSKLTCCDGDQGRSTQQKYTCLYVCVHTRIYTYIML